MEAQKAIREATNLRVVIKESDLMVLKRGQGQLHREVEMQDEKIKGLLATCSQHSAQLTKAHRSIQKLQEDLDHEIHDRDDRMKYLEKEVEVMTQERNDAFEQARLVHLDIEEMKTQLKEEEAKHEKLRQEATQTGLVAERQRESFLSEIRALQGRHDHLEWEAYWFEVVDNYCNDTLKKVELALRSTT